MLEVDPSTELFRSGTESGWEGQTKRNPENTVLRGFFGFEVCSEDRNVGSSRRFGRSDMGAGFCR
jgi:hypothetical protein